MTGDRRPEVVASAVDGSHPVVAAFDLGSNSIKMSLARKTTETSFSEFLWRAETTRLGEGIDRTGRLSADRMTASMETLRRFVVDAKFHGATRLIGVATEAIRIADNGALFLEQVRSELGIEIQTISGLREAELTFAGLDPAVDRAGTVLVADIGGASLELILAIDGSIIESRSVPIGSGRLTDRFVRSDPPTMQEIDEVRAYAHQTVKEVLTVRLIDRLIVTGGTAEYARRLMGRDWPVTVDRLLGTLPMLTSTTAADLAEIIDASVPRAQVLPSGIAIALALADLGEPQELVGAASGIRTGLLIEAFANAEGHA